MTKKSIAKSYESKKRVVSIFAALALFTLGTESAFAGHAKGLVTGIATEQVRGDWAYISVQNETGMAACAGGNRFIVDLNKPAGRAVYSMALAANIAGRTVEINGTGACGIQSADGRGTDSEDVSNAIITQ